MLLLTSLLTMVACGPVRTQGLVCPQYKLGDHTLFFSNPDDYGSYYMCDAGGNPILMYCPSGLYWNTNLNVCDGPTNVDSKGGSDRSGESDGSDGSGGSGYAPIISPSTTITTTPTTTT